MLHAPLITLTPHLLVDYEIASEIRPLQVLAPIQAMIGTAGASQDLGTKIFVLSEQP